jgi:hypothetical protein
VRFTFTRNEPIFSLRVAKCRLILYYLYADIYDPLTAHYPLRKVKTK